MNPDISDIQACRRGDSQAFEHLVRRYEKRAVSTAYHMLGNWEDAREAAQDMFVKAFQAIGNFDPSKSFATWIYRILINTCIDYRRRREISAEAIGITPFSMLSSDIRTVDPAAENFENRDILARALSKLSDKHRAVITLRDLQGLSSREVGRILKCSEATVRVHLFNARRQLKKVLRPLMHEMETGNPS